MGLVTMNEKELARLGVIQDLIAKRIKPALAAQLLGLKPRQVRKLRQEYAAAGPPALASRRRGKPSNRRMPDQFRLEVIRLLRTHYSDFGPTFASQKLLEQHQIALSPETVRIWMKAEGLWIDRRSRSKVVHQPRMRRSCYGELVQIDGSEHYWFEDRAPMCTLLVYIDDATGKLMQLKFVKSESAFSYFRSTTEYIEGHGKPVAFYSDKHSIFRVPKKDAVGGTGMTQFGRALHELNIDIICANTPQAKGRVERANRTLQDRLVKELRLHGICSMDEGNAYLPEFMDDFNRRFGRPPLNDKNLHRPLNGEERLDEVFVWREERTVSAALTIQYDKSVFILEPNEVSKGLARKKVTVADHPDGRLVISYQGHPLPYRMFDTVRRVDQGAIVDNKRLSAALRHIREEQALRPQYRSERAPKRADQAESRFQPGVPCSRKRRARRKATGRRNQLPVIHATTADALPIKRVSPARIGSYEDELMMATSYQPPRDVVAGSRRSRGHEKLS